jgi:hypothetical protein
MSDLSGTWLGTYWQAKQPTRFEATLVQAGNSLSGRVLDDSYLGEAQLEGQVIGRQVSFSKRYLTTSPTAIEYTGTVSEDGNSIQGEWRVGRFDTGPWEARRGTDELSASFQQWAAKTAAPVAAPASSSSD